MGQRLQRSLVLGALLTGLAAAGCSSDPVTAVQIQVRNDTDDFQFSATAVSQASDLRSYTWQNTGTGATVTVTTMSSAGTAHLVIRDAASSVVYDAELQPNSTATTATGVAGAWRIAITLTDYTGTVALSVQKL